MLSPCKVDKVTDNSTSGSVLIETAVVLPVLLLVFLLFIRLLQVVALGNCVERATLQTAKTMSQYAVLYHAYGVVTLEEEILSAIDVERAEDFIDLRGYIQSGEDALYSGAAQNLVTYYLKQDPLVRNGYVRYTDLSCYGSTFFANKDDIVLRVSYKAYHLFPLSTSLCFRGWVRGDSPLSSLFEEGVSVWSFDNFTRGRMIRDLFGGDLPYHYPVIASFEEGVALMIKSIDATKPTYQDTNRLKQEVQEMLDKLRDFQGVDGEIEPAAIKAKKLLLVIPENTPSEQTNVLLEMAGNQAVVQGIQVEVQFYQESCH